MKTTFLREVTLYRYRYIVGYVAFGILLFALLLFAIEQAPRGLSNQEMNSAVTSVNINVFRPTSTNIIDAPYHVLQKISIQQLGLTTVSIKLPSIIIGAITGVCIVLMLKKWFRRNVAIITAIMVVTSVGFLSLARSGTPMIMTMFWSVILLLGATQVLHATKHRFIWRLVCLAATAFLAYSPFGIYPLLAIVIAGFFHPHVRHQFKRGTWWQNLIAGLTVLIILLPLIIATIYNPAIGLTLLGVQTGEGFQASQTLTNGAQIIDMLFNFTNNTVGVVVTPLFGLATAALLILGLLKLLTASYSARSYMIFIWLGLLIPVLIFRPDMVLLVIVPATLILAIGIETLIRQWYDIFPRNPYARIAALVPLSVLLFSIITIDMSRYFYGHHYSPLAIGFHAELPAVRTNLDTHQVGTSNPVTIVTPPEQVAFYDLLRREFPKVTVVSDPGDKAPPLFVLHNSPAQITGKLPTRIITSDLSQPDQAVLLRVYAR